MKFRQQYGGQQAIPGAQRNEVLIEMLKKLFQHYAPNQGGNRQGGRPPHHGGAYPMQNQGQARPNPANKGQYQGNRDGRSQGRQGNMPPMQQPKPGMNMGGPGPMQNPGQPNMMPQNPMGGPGPQNFGQPPQQQPMNAKEAYLMRCTPLIKGVVPNNPYYKQQVGTAIFGFVE